MGVHSTKLRIENDTFTDITNIVVWSVDSFDWKNPHRPDTQFGGGYIEAKTYIERDLLVNKRASISPFNMKFTYSDGLIDSFRIDQKYAVGQAANFDHIERTHDITYRKRNNTLVINVKNTASQLLHFKFEETLKLADKSVNQVNYNEALAKLDAALGLTDDPSIKRNIISKKIATLTKYSDKILDDSLKCELNQKLSEAKVKLGLAKSLLQQAILLQSSDTLVPKVQLIDILIEGYKSLSEGDALYRDGNLLYVEKDSEKMILAKEKIENAIRLYEKAKNEFEKGKKTDLRFEDIITFVNRAIIKAQDTNISFEKDNLGIDIRFDSSDA